MFKFFPTSSVLTNYSIAFNVPDLSISAMIAKPDLIYLIVLLFNAVIITGKSSPGVQSINKCFQYNSLSRTKHNLGYIKRLKRNSFPLYSRVYLGKDARTGQLPFMAALGYKNNNIIKYICGGTLISNRFVLTAAHCIYARNWGLVMHVRLGDLNLVSTSDDIRVQNFVVQNYFVHPKYSSNFKYHDIALIFLDRPAIFCPQVAPACLEPNQKNLINFELYIAGWGAIGYGQSLSDHLQVGTLREYNQTICQRAYPKDIFLPYGLDDRSQICAGAITGFSDTCEGDSGGPLAYLYELPKKKLYFLVGVTSFGKPCSAAQTPGVYTRVSYYLDWIENITWFNEPVEPEEVGLLYQATTIDDNSANRSNRSPMLYIGVIFMFFMCV